LAEINVFSAKKSMSLKALRFEVRSPWYFVENLALITCLSRQCYDHCNLMQLLVIWT